MENSDGENMSDDQEDLYEILGVSNKATPEEIKKGYYRMALKYHPDKNPGDQSASEKFLQIGKAYEVLSNPEKKAVYDETGTVLGDDALDAFSKQAAKNWDEYFRALFKQFTKDDLESFEKAYKGSNTEKEDIKEAYRKCGGQLQEIFEYVPLCTSSDVDRFVEILEKAIELGQVDESANFRQSKKRLSKIKNQMRANEEKEAVEYEKISKKSKKNGENTTMELQKKIKTKQQMDMEKLAADLEAKYSKGKKKTKGNVSQEPSEEEFLKAQQRIMERMKKK